MNILLYFILFCNTESVIGLQPIPYFTRNKCRQLTTLSNPNFRNSNNHDNNVELLRLSYRKRNKLSNQTNQNNFSSIESEALRWPFILILLSQFILFIGVGAIIPAIPLYGQSIGLSQAANGIVISAPAVMLLLGAKWCGNFADQARKPAMMIGMAMIAIFDIGTAFATSLPALIVARLGLGAGRCVTESGERGMIADIAGQIPTLRGRALAAQQAIVALGVSIGAPLGGLVVELYGPRASFLCVSIGAVIALFIYAFLPETVPTKVDTESGRMDNISNGDWSQLLRDRRWQGLALIQSGASFGFAAKISCIPIIATATLPGGAVGTGALISLAGLSGIVGAPLGGWLTDQMGARFTATFSGLLSTTGLVLIPFILNQHWFDVSAVDVSIPFFGGNLDSTNSAFVCAVLLWSLGATAQGPALTALAQQLAPIGEESTSLALPRAAGDGTYIAAPFILGAIADATSTDLGLGLECAFAGFAGLLGILALFLTIDEMEKKE
jgi:MFS family permease